MATIRKGDRTINTGVGNYNANVSGSYNERIEGDYVEGKQQPNSGSGRTERDITDDSEVSDGMRRYYVENLGGKKVNRWFK